MWRRLCCMYCAYSCVAVQAEVMVLDSGICFAQMKKDSDFLKRKDEVADFNSKHKWLKRGISMTHCRCVCSHLAAGL